MNCPHCDVELTEEEIRSLWGSMTGRRQTPHAGPGRPPYKKRCPCGAMTVDRAKLRSHKCVAPKKTPRKTV
jgi:hypothetical protein